MLYERWRQIARSAPDEIALRDLATERQWTFAELASAAEQVKAADGKIVFPQGISAEFILAVLAAWRQHQIVCPLEQEQAPPKFSTAVPKGVVHLKTTSASTGASRMIAFTASQLMADAENIVATMGLRPDWPNLGVISLAHSYGFSNLVLPLLLHGIPLIVVNTPLPEFLKRAARAEKDLTLAGVPALWRAWHDADAIPANIRLAISAGAPLPVGLEQNVFAMRGLKIHNFYGSSECGGIAYDGTTSPRLDASCVGAPMRNVCVSIAENGCLDVRSAAVGQTYWPAAAPALNAGVFHTSDLAVIAFGLVYLRGRVTDQINVAGRKVSPESIEKVLATHPAVRECLIFGAPVENGDRSEIVVACFVPREPVTGDALRQFMLEKLPAWQVPREWWQVESLSVNERGKISRADWRKRFVELTAAGENMP